MKSRKFIKNLLIAIIVVVIVLGIFSLTIYFKYRSFSMQNLPPEFISAKVLPTGNEVSLGTAIDYTLIYKLPWNKYPEIIKVTPGEGSQLVGTPNFQKKIYRWGYTEWAFNFKVQPFVDKEIPEGKTEINIGTFYSNQLETIDYIIPPIKVLPIENNTNELITAPKATNKIIASISRIYLYIMLIVIIALIVIFLLIMKKKKEKIKIQEPWETALINLNELESSLNTGNINPIKSIFRLTDIVRGYLEERFKIRAPQQTTDEFLKNMENEKSPLSNVDRNFLKEYMISSDMIKFAKYEANKEMASTSIKRAADLIRSTIPNESNNEHLTEKK